MPKIIKPTKTAAFSGSFFIGAESVRYNPFYRQMILRNENNRNSNRQNEAWILPKSGGDYADNIIAEKAKVLRHAAFGGSAMKYLVDRITDNALCLPDEPENCLSISLQQELRRRTAY